MPQIFDFWKPSCYHKVMSKQLPTEQKILESLLKSGKHLQAAGETLSSGALVRMMRQALGMTQNQLAHLAHMPRSTITRIENETIKPNEETLKKIFNAMECDLAYIPIPRFSNLQEMIKRRAYKVIEKRADYLEGTMALEKQRPKKNWRKQMIENETEKVLKKPSSLWKNNGKTI
jgi:transcriptional regulator with XRE-family HTH domain